MKTIARPEIARGQRNAPRPAPVVRHGESVPRRIAQIMAEERAAAFAKRSVKTLAKLAGLK